MDFINDSNNNLILIESVVDIENAKKFGKFGVIIGSKGVRHFKGDILKIDEFYNKGQREVQLNWNGENQAWSNGHLTQFGLDLIEKCNNLGILIDISHMSINKLNELLATPEYLNNPKPLILVLAIEYTISLIGIDHIALGGDYFPEDNCYWIVDEVNNLPELTKALVHRGFTDEEIKKILGQNLLNLYSSVW